MPAPRIPEEKKKKLAKELAKGKSMRAASAVVGVDHHLREGTNADVQRMLGKELTAARKYTGTTKEDVLDLIMEAVALARLIEDPACMIMGARELSKMLGYNAPEVKKVTHDLGAETLKALENLSDAELMKISKGRVIDAEVVLLEGPK